MPTNRIQPDNLNQQPDLYPAFFVRKALPLNASGALRKSSEKRIVRFKTKCKALVKPLLKALAAKHLHHHK